MPVRIGIPHNIEGLTDMVKDPSYATGVGLILCGSQSQTHDEIDFDESKGISGVFSKIGKWFQGSF